MKQLVSIIFIATLLFTISCNKRILKFNPDKEKAIKVMKNKQFTLSFESTPSSGYNWVLDYNSDSTIIEFLQKNIKKQQKDLNLLGGKVNEIWEFKANNSGKVNLIFYYKRNWEDKTPIDSALYKIKVK